MMLGCTVILFCVFSIFFNEVRQHTNLTPFLSVCLSIYLYLFIAQLSLYPLYISPLPLHWCSAVINITIYHLELPIRLEEACKAVIIHPNAYL